MSLRVLPVLGQVIRYIAELDRDRDKILSKDRCDTLKIRARVIVGRDGDLGHQEGLRNLNAHLHRIEVVTFDQLVRIAARVLDVFESDRVVSLGQAVTKMRTVGCRSDKEIERTHFVRRSSPSRSPHRESTGVRSASTTAHLGR